MIHENKQTNRNQKAKGSLLFVGLSSLTYKKNTNATLPQKKKKDYNNGD